MRRLWDAATAKKAITVFLSVVFGLYGLFLIKVILFKNVYSRGALVEHVRRLDLGQIRMNLRAANYLPTKTIAGYLSSDLSRTIVFNNLIGNVALFIPFGVFVFLLISRSIRVGLFVGFGSSLLLELIQLLFSLGSFDIDDILLNSIGTFIGVVIGIISITGLKKLIRYLRF